MSFEFNLEFWIYWTDEFSNAISRPKLAKSSVDSKIIIQFTKLVRLLYNRICRHSGLMIELMDRIQNFINVNWHRVIAIFRCPWIDIIQSILLQSLHHRLGIRRCWNHYPAIRFVIYTDHVYVPGTKQLNLLVHAAIEPSIYVQLMWMEP